MSLESWKEEFYPVPASEFMSDEVGYIKHSLRKWEGALFHNVQKHALLYDCHTIRNSNNSGKFSFDSDSCSLCVRYVCRLHELASACALVCPIRKVTGRPCDTATPHTYGMSMNDPRPMIALLKQVLSEVEKGLVK